ncbi:tautomerase family protein [Mycobacterium sp. Dal123C01]|uniref:tautomerase family protein n=1 Tax=Mycobacterium sp. Dal123C01 TaxID=3457577 RepID=UPI00403ED9AA
MPTYVCLAGSGQISAGQRQRIAAGITLIHSECTGAPPAFVQCIFQDLDATSHYIGAEPAPQSVWVYGHIRDGRDEGVRERILIRISELLVDILHIDPSLTWAYINPLANTDMVEFGRTLPLPGAEQQWIEQMPAGVREPLLELNERATR